MKLRNLEDLDQNGALKNKKVFLRLDLNVPIKNGKIKDDTRIQAALPTIKFLLERTSKLTLCSHLGRPKDRPEPEYSVEPVGVRLAELLKKEVAFVKDYLTESPAMLLDTLPANQIMLLENLRFNPGETKNDAVFSQKLAKGFNFYVNDAFGTVHRAHASVAGVAECFPPEHRAAGFLIHAEVNALNQLIEKPQSPFTVVMGGAKVSDKIAVLLHMMSLCNNLVIGGAMAYTFLKFRGIQVGKSTVEGDKMDLVESIYRAAEARKVKIFLPEDHVAGKEFVETTEAVNISEPAITDGLMGLDIGPKTAKIYSEVIKQSKTVFWNGPMGVFEWSAFSAGTMAIAKAMSECKGKTVIGGGDSVSAVNKSGVADKMTHISTGGGASLEYLEGQTLPGIKVLLG